MEVGGSGTQRAVEVGVVSLVTILGPFLFWFVRNEPSLRYNVISSLAVGIALFGSLGPMILDDVIPPRPNIGPDWSRGETCWWLCPFC